MFYLIGLVFTTVSVSLAVWPSKYDPLTPERKRRDWPVVFGLYMGGVVAYIIAYIITIIIFRRFGGGNVLSLFQNHRKSRHMTFTKTIHLALALLLFYLAFEEVFLIPQEGRKRSTATTGIKIAAAQASGEVQGTWDLTLSFPTTDGKIFNMVTRNMALPPEISSPVGGTPWPTPVWYNPANPSTQAVQQNIHQSVLDAVARDPTTPRWWEIGSLCGVAGLLTAQAMM